MVNSAFHSSDVDEMKIKNSPELVVKKKMSPCSGSTASTHMLLIHKRGKRDLFFIFAVKVHLKICSIKLQLMEKELKKIMHVFQSLNYYHLIASKLPCVAPRPKNKT